MMIMITDYDDDTDNDNDHKNDCHTAVGAAPGASVPCSFITRNRIGSKFKFTFMVIIVLSRNGISIELSIRECMRKDQLTDNS